MQLNELSQQVFEFVKQYVSPEMEEISVQLSCSPESQVEIETDEITFKLPFNLRLELFSSQIEQVVGKFSSFSEENKAEIIAQLKKVRDTLALFADDIDTRALVKARIQQVFNKVVEVKNTELWSACLEVFMRKKKDETSDIRSIVTEVLWELANTAKVPRPPLVFTPAASVVADIAGESK